MTDRSQSSLLGMDRAELAALVESVGEPAYRTRQLMDAVYRQRAESVDEISTLPQELREKLAEKGVSIGLPRIEQRFVSQDGTVRYLIAMADGQSVETVWMPEGDGGEAGDGSEAGEQAERFAESGSFGASGTKALSAAEPTAALKRCATQKQRPSKKHNDRSMDPSQALGLNHTAGTESGAVDDLHFQPGRMRRGLPVLSDGAAWRKAESDRR